MQTQNQNTPELPAAEVRVKKEEFAHAIAALEARRQAEAQQQEGTVVIGDVLEQLQINVPAEEVLQEIQALHAGKPHEELPKRSSWTAERVANTKLVSGIVLIPLVTIILAGLLFNPFHPPGSMLAAGANNSGPIWIMPPPNLPPHVTGPEMDESGFNASSILKPLSAVPDEQPISCNTASLTKLFSSNSVQSGLSNQLFDVRPGLHKPWVLIKHDNHVYLRAWVSTRFTQEQSRQHLVLLHSTPDSFEAGIEPVKITLPIGVVNKLSFWGTTGRDATFGLTNVQIDEHAWEDWKP